MRKYKFFIMLIWYQNNKQSREDFRLKPPHNTNFNSDTNKHLLFKSISNTTHESGKSMENLSLNCNMYKPN